MSALDGPIGYAGKDAVGPGVTIGEDHHRQPELGIEPLDETPRGAGRLALDMHQYAIELLIKAVLNQPGIHAAGLNGHDHPGVVTDKFDVVHIEGYLVAGLAHIILAVQLLLSSPGLLLEAQRPEDRSPILLRPDMEVLPVQRGYYLQILDQPV